MNLVGEMLFNIAPPSSLSFQTSLAVFFSASLRYFET